MQTAVAQAQLAEQRELAELAARLHDNTITWMPRDVDASLLIDGDVRAAAELERVVTLHAESKRYPRHLLDLANLYATISAEYVDHFPPESLDFDPAEFRDLVDSSARLYEMVAARDGTTEKIEATRRLEAFLAFALSVDRDRFTP